VIVAAAPRDALKIAPVALAAVPATFRLTAIAAPQASNNAGGDE